MRAVHRYLHNYSGEGNTTDPIVPTTGFSPVAYM